MTFIDIVRYQKIIFLKFFGEILTPKPVNK